MSKEKILAATPRTTLDLQPVQRSLWVCTAVFLLMLCGFSTVNLSLFSSLGCSPNVETNTTHYKTCDLHWVPAMVTAQLISSWQMFFVLVLPRRAPVLPGCSTLQPKHSKNWLGHLLWGCTLDQMKLLAYVKILFKLGYITWTLGDDESNYSTYHLVF